MLSPGQALDIPDLQTNENQARIAALGITISQFQKTLQGRAIIERQEPFILAGMVYQGYNQKAIEVPEDHLTVAELEATHDIDGSKQRILDTRRRRLEGNAQAKDREHGERRKIKVAQERDELELMLLRRKLAREDAAAEPEAEPEGDPDPDPDPLEYRCDREGCGRTFETAGKLRGHKVGAKHT